MPRRLDDLKQWLDRRLAGDPFELAPASSDASFRRYFRVSTGGRTIIAMDAPPEKEDSRPYVDIAGRLLRAGLTVPEILAMDLDRGFLLVTDLGADLYLDHLNNRSKEALYGDAMDALFTMQTRVSMENLPVYDEAMLGTEIDLFRQWFLERHLGLVLEDEHRRILGQESRRLIQAALSQPQVFVHRDYHSRNLMVMGSGNPGILDFQGAVVGPITYDLASLLRDCYIAWPEADVSRWASTYYHRLVAAGILADTTQEQFEAWLDLMGLQRHLKAIGIFARLYHRDGKAGYLHDIPRTLDYVVTVAARYAELAPLGELLEAWSVKARHLAMLTRADNRSAAP